MGRRRFSRGPARSEMKTLECPRCHSQIRLDEYKEHLANCKPEAQTESPAAPDS